jgi:hypothetical protein
MSTTEGNRFFVDSSSWSRRMKTEITGWRHWDVGLPICRSMIFLSSPSSNTNGNPVWSVVSQTPWSSVWYWSCSCVLNSSVVIMKISTSLTVPDLLGSGKTHMYPWTSPGRSMSSSSPSLKKYVNTVLIIVIVPHNGHNQDLFRFLRSVFYSQLKIKKWKCHDRTMIPEIGPGIHWEEETLVYHEEIKRHLNRILIYECRCNEGLRTTGEVFASTRIHYRRCSTYIS